MAPLFEIDPVSENAANSPLEIWNTTDYTVTAFSSPKPPLKAQWASSVDTEGGALAGTPDHDNRTINITVDVASVTGLRNLQAKLGKITREGGTAKLTFPNSEVIIFDLLVTDTYDPQLDITYYVNSGAFCTVQFSVIAKPYGRGPSVTLSDHVETTLPALIFTETGIKGDWSAQGELIVDNDVAADQLTLLWAIQSKEYDATSTGALFFEAESSPMTLGTGVLNAGPAGASGGGVNKTVRQTSSGTAIVATLTTAGDYRLFARVQVPATNNGAVTINAQYRRTGDILTTDTASILIDPAQEGHWLLVELGPITIPRGLKGTHSWLVATKETMTVGADVIYYDWLMVVPVNEGSGEIVGSTANPAVASSTSAAIRSDSVLVGSTTWGRPTKYEGDYLRIPPAGAEGRTVRVLVKMSRALMYVSGATGTAYYDDSTDDLSARLTYTPRYLVLPSP